MIKKIDQLAVDTPDTTRGMKCDKCGGFVFKDYSGWTCINCGKEWVLREVGGVMSDVLENKISKIEKYLGHPHPPHDEIK